MFDEGIDDSAVVDPTNKTFLLLFSSFEQSYLFGCHARVYVCTQNKKGLAPKQAVKEASKKAKKRSRYDLTASHTAAELQAKLDSAHLGPAKKSHVSPLASAVGGVKRPHVSPSPPPPLPDVDASLSFGLVKAKTGALRVRLRILVSSSSYVCVCACICEHGLLMKALHVCIFHATVCCSTCTCVRTCVRLSLKVRVRYSVL